MLRAGTSFVSDVIDGKPVGVAARSGLKKFTIIRNKKCRRDDSGNIPEIRNKKRRRHDSGIISKIRNKKRCCDGSGIIPKKHRCCKQDIFFIMTERITNALELFSKPQIQTSIVKGSWVEVRPTNSLDDDSAIDFEIFGSGTDFLDLANTL